MLNRKLAGVLVLGVAAMTLTSCDDRDLGEPVEPMQMDEAASAPAEEPDLPEERAAPEEAEDAMSYDEFYGSSDDDAGAGDDFADPLENAGGDDNGGINDDF